MEKEVRKIVAEFADYFINCDQGSALFVVDMDMNDSMWDIDSRISMGHEVSEAQKEFYNAHIDGMRVEVSNDYQHWLRVKKLDISGGG